MILPGATLGMLGGGQLGRMFAYRAHEMGYRVVILEPDAASPAGAVADEHLVGGYDDAAILDQLARRCDAVSTEFENVPATTLEYLAQRTVVHPSARAVAIAQDRLSEKQHVEAAGLPVGPYEPVDSADATEAASRRLGGPCVLKRRRLGYDGKGQCVVPGPGDAQAAFAGLGGVPCVLELRLTLAQELSVILARGADGRCEAFPVAQNEHRDGILHTTIVPARVSGGIVTAVLEAAVRIAASLGYVGVLAVEFFVDPTGAWYVNELAPRPHNSGHYTIDACTSDQFEQQVRAMCGLPLAAPELLAPTAMVNLLGDLWSGGPPPWDRVLAMPGVRLHLYGKSTPRPGRKMGHLTATATDAAAAHRLAIAAYDSLVP